MLVVTLKNVNQCRSKLQPHRIVAFLDKTAIPLSQSRNLRTLTIWLWLFATEGLRVLTVKA